MTIAGSAEQDARPRGGERRKERPAELSTAK